MWCSLAWFALLLLPGLSDGVNEQIIPRPDHAHHAQLARWLAHYNDWGTLSTQGDQGPAAGVVSFTDGPLTGAAAGRLFFFLTALDETGHNIQEHPECSLSVSEAQLHPQGCQGTDPMEPTCARMAAFGRMLPVEAADRVLAQQLLFEKHPAMKGWPADHGFDIYELHLREIHMLDWYGGMHIISPDEYFAAKLQPDQHMFIHKAAELPRRFVEARQSLHLRQPQLRQEEH